MFINSDLQTLFSSAVDAIRNSRHDNWFRNLPLAIGLPLAVATLLLFPIVALVMYCVYTLGDIMLNGSISFSANASHVPTFYAPRHASENWHVFIVVILATGFGATHCAGWNFIFPTYTEERLWRLASLAVTIIPCLLFCILFTVKGLLKLLKISFRHAERNFAGFASILFVLVYVAARLVILAQGVALLRHQPPSAFTAVDWSKFYPHIF